jgi:integrase
MSSAIRMTERLDEYLAMRRAFGSQLRIAGRQLRRFAEFADCVAGGEPLTVDLILRWAQSSSTGKQLTAACRLRVVRPFARYMQTIDPLTQIPSPRLLGPAQQRCNPHIYADDEITSLLAATRKLKPRAGLRPQTMLTYLSLLACTGMRPAEPFQLMRDDVDLPRQLLTLRKTKFSKSRVVVLHETAAKALEAYAQVRDRKVPRPRTDAFFLRDDGEAFTHDRAMRTFQFLRRQLKWESFKPLPRLHHFRHTFVCRHFLSWYREGVDVDRMILPLSTYLGHVSAEHTYWYISGIPELMEIAGGWFEKAVTAREVGR